MAPPRLSDDNGSKLQSFCDGLRVDILAAGGTQHDLLHTAKDVVQRLRGVQTGELSLSGRMWVIEESFDVLIEWRAGENNFVVLPRVAQ